MLRLLYNRLRSIWHRRRKDSELDEEIRFHLAADAEERIDGGLAPEQARSEAQRDFGNVLLTRELTRETWGWAPAELLLRDIGSALRMMRRNTGYTCAVVLTMALGIGLNAPMYEMLSRLFIQPPPHIEDPDAVHRVWLSERDDSEDRGAFTGPAVARDRMQWPEFSALSADNAPTGAVAGYTAPRFTPNGRGQTAENLRVSWVTGEFLDLLGVEPVVGRLIGPEDDDPAAAPVAVVSDGYQRERFASPREALGATLEFDDVTYVVVGVLPSGFSGPDPDRADVWLPLEPAVTGSRGDRWRRFGSGFSLTPLVRLPPGLTVETAGAAATAAVRAARADSPFGGSLDPEATVVLGSILRTRGPSSPSGEIRLALVVGGVTLLVLLIATVNMSNLLLVRVAARRRELAVRYALGAGRWGVGRLLAIESLVLAAVSGAAALIVAAVVGRTLRLTLLPGHQGTVDALNLTAVGFTGIAVLAVGLCATIAPAVYAARSRQIERLDSSRGASAFGTPVRTGLIVVQAALSLVLLCGTAVFYRSFEAARQVDIGYVKEHLLTVELGDFGGSPLDESTVSAMEARVRNLPGVRQVAQSTNTPMGRIAMVSGLRLEGHDRPPFRYGPYVNLTSTNFFDVAGLEVLEGRGFNEWDRTDTQKVAVVNTTFAQQAWPSRSPVGRCLFVGSEATDCTTVVGVVESALEFGLIATDGHPVYFLPISQTTSSTSLSGFAASRRVLIVRTRDNPGTVVAPVLGILGDLFPNLPRRTVQSLPAIFASQIKTWRIGTRLFGASAALAVLLAAIGLYAVIAFGVRQRELEFGIRRALGARASRLLRMVLARGFSLAAAGVAAGALAALWAGRFIEPLLFDGRTPRDPLAFAAAALVLLTIAVMASYLPARRASRADPRQALEAE